MFAMFTEDACRDCRNAQADTLKKCYDAVHERIGPWSPDNDDKYRGKYTMHSKDVGS